MHSRGFLVSALLFLCILAVDLSAGPFTPGNLVVTRVGDGAAPLTSAATQVFLVEYTPTGVPVQVIALPIVPAGPHRRLTDSGTATSNLMLTRSTDANFLTLTGYDAAVGTANVAGTTSVAVNRVVARVDGAGTIDTTTALTDAYSGSNIRASVSDAGLALWLAGTGSGATGGVRYTTLGATSSVLLSPSPTNIRTVNIFSGQLFCGSATGAFQGVSQVGVGLPTTGGQVITLLPGFPIVAGPSTYDFHMADPITLYVADDRSVATGGGVQKWVFSGTWNLLYTLNAGLGTVGCRGLTGITAGSVTTLYAITGEASGAPTRLVSVVDIGPGSAFAVLAVSAPNSSYRGVDFTPGVPPINDCNSNGTPDELEGLPDCNSNGTPDVCEPGSDCNSNGIPDFCEFLPDCNSNGIPDACEFLPDCNSNGIPNVCEPGSDCNSNFIPDYCEFLSDCNLNGIPDICEPGSDCNSNGIPDFCEFLPDCNSNGIPDACEFLPDCNSNGIPNVCEPGSDCNSNFIPDYCEFLSDCNLNGIPDICEPGTDCNSNGIPDFCEFLPDCNSNGIPDACEFLPDCNSNGIPNVCEPGTDCNTNFIPDYCEFLSDCNLNGIPDICEPGGDCNSNGIPDFCEFLPDCNSNGIPDACEFLPDCNSNGIPNVCEPGTDCNTNSIPDYCEFLSDCNLNGIPDICEPGGDCNSNGIPDFCEFLPDCNSNGIPDVCEFAPDCNSNGVPDVCEPLIDCNSNGTLDACEFLPDCNSNGIPNACEPGSDCNSNQTPDYCEFLADCNANGTPDVCESLSDCNSNGTPDICEALTDCDANGTPDACEPFVDCNSNGTRDACEILPDCNSDGTPDVCQSLPDCNSNGVPDQCEPVSDCNNNGTPDFCEVLRDCNTNLTPDVCETFGDCNTNGSPDLCERGGEHDCNTNGATDICDIDGGISEDCNFNRVPDECESLADCNTNGVPDVCEMGGTQGCNSGEGGICDPLADCNTNDIPDECEPGYLIDCNTNGDPDLCESLYGSDCDSNGVPDLCDLYADCNQNGRPDACEPFSGTDCNSNGVFDLCEPGGNSDCNTNGVSDICDLVGDCNSNLTPDVCETGYVDDCNLNGVPDLCEGYADCNTNGEWDACDIVGGLSADCDTNQTPDECQSDCNANGTPDTCDILGGGSTDCNTNQYPDECELANVGDCNSNGIVDACEGGADCNTNSAPDACDIDSGFSDDCNTNGVPDECDPVTPDCNTNGLIDVCESESDCNTNGIADVCDVAQLVVDDCDNNGVPDECDIAAGDMADCDTNAVPDPCEAADCNQNGTLDACETSPDCDSDGTPDECEPDCDFDGTADICEILMGQTDCNTDGILDVCQDCNTNATADACEDLLDCNTDGVPDVCQSTVGDMNTDGYLDGDDLQLFTNCMLLGDDTCGSCLAADVNTDGILSETDIALMSTLLVGGIDLTCVLNICTAVILMDTNNNGAIDPATDGPNRNVAPGKYICVNLDDDNRDGIADKDQVEGFTFGRFRVWPTVNEDDLAELQIFQFCLRNDVKWKFEYDTTKVKLFLANDRVDKITHNQLYDMPPPGRIWVEGLAPAAGIDITFKIVRNAGGAVVACDTLKVTVVQYDLDVDTDRNGTIEDADESRENAWRSARGAIYLVNNDDDNGDGIPDNFVQQLMTVPSDRDGNHRPMVGLSLPAFDFDCNGVADANDNSINGANDLPDITPFEINDAGVAGATVVLRVASTLKEHIRIFQRIAAGQASLFGPDTATPGATFDIDITALALGAGRKTLGIEGITYRQSNRAAVAAVGPYPALDAVQAFDGFVKMTLRVTMPGGHVCQDQVTLKVAPYLMQSHITPSSNIFVLNVGDENRCFRERSGADAVATNYGDVWCQDEVEFGYAKAPHAANTRQMSVCFDLPRERGLDGSQPPPARDHVRHTRLWPERDRMRRDVGWWGFPKPPNADSGEYGGNLEMIPATARFPVGKVYYGNSMRDNVANRETIPKFLRGQELQSPIAVPDEWLAVRHVDELIGIARHNATFRAVLANPRLARQMVLDLPNAENGRAAFWGAAANVTGATCIDFSGSERSDRAVAFLGGDTPATQLRRTGFDFTAAVGGLNWHFVRIYNGTGAGQVAHISARANHIITIDRVWRTGQTLVSQNGDSLYKRVHEENNLLGVVESQNHWFVNPDATSEFVLVSETRRWANYVFARSTRLTANAAAAQNRVSVRSVTGFAVGDRCTIRDDMGNNQDVNIDQILTPGGMDPVIVFDANLGVAYATADIARVSKFEENDTEADFVPALWSVRELKADLNGDLGAFQTRADARIRGAAGFTVRKALLDANALAAGDIVEAPVLFWGELVGNAGLRRGEALTPDIVNFQTATVGGGIRAFVPRQYFVRVADRVGVDDIFEREFRRVLPDASTPKEFIHDWNIYHRMVGDLHCGSAVRREIPAAGWWTETYTTPIEESAP